MATIRKHQIREWSKVDGKIDVDKIRKAFSCRGAKIESREDGSVLVTEDVNQEFTNFARGSGGRGRVQTLRGDMGQCGFKIRWLSGQSDKQTARPLAFIAI